MTGLVVSVANILLRAQTGRDVVEEFCPFAQSLEWDIGQAYLRGRGSGAFISDAVRVPFAVNNVGLAQAAEVLFETCRKLELETVLPEQIYVLEIGIGLGLFARFFLDHFRRLSAEHEQDFYQRIQYILGDYSEQMLMDVCRHGVLVGHLGKWHVRVVDARDPAAAFASAGSADKGEPQFDLVVLNYLLDCLPAAILRSGKGELRQLCVRTCLARSARLADYTHRTPAELAPLAKGGDARSREELNRLADLFVAEYAFLPVDANGLPHLASTHVTEGATHVHSYGAIDSLERLIPLLSDHGGILINDYGSTEADLGTDLWLRSAASC